MNREERAAAAARYLKGRDEMVFFKLSSSRHQPEPGFRAIHKGAMSLIRDDMQERERIKRGDPAQPKKELSPGELLALGAGLLDYQEWLSNEVARLYDEQVMVESAIKLVYKTADAIETMPETINPLADGLGLRRRALGDRLKGVRFVNETEETGGKRWRVGDVIRNLLAERYRRGTPIVFKKGHTGRQLSRRATPREGALTILLGPGALRGSRPRGSRGVTGAIPRSSAGRRARPRR